MSRGFSSCVTLILFIVVPPVLIFGVAIALSLVPLPYQLSRSRDLVAAVGSGILGLVYIIGLAIYLIWWVFAYSQSADPAFTQQGLDASTYILFGRQYHGRVHGRSVDVCYMPPQQLRPGSLEIRLRTTLQTRLTVSVKRPLLGCEGCRPLEVNDPDLARLQVLAQDEAWARRLLADPAGKAAVLRLMYDEGSSSGWREVYVQPGTLLLRRRPGEITAEGVRQWLMDLSDLARVGECFAAQVAHWSES